MSEPTAAERQTAKPEATKKPEVTKKGTAPAPKQARESPAKPALAKLRRALGELITAHRTGATHMVPVYVFHLRSALTAANGVRGSATEAERKELAEIEPRVQKLLSAPTPAVAKGDATPKHDDDFSPSDLQIDWEDLSNAIDQIVPGVGSGVLKAPQLYRDVIEAITRSTLFAAQAFKEQWAQIRDHWYEFLYTTVTLLAAELGVVILAAAPETVVTKIAAVALQALLIAFLIEASVSVGEVAGAYAQTFWANVQAANGDMKMIDAAALNFARMVVVFINAIAMQIGFSFLSKAARNAMGPNPAGLPRTQPGPPAGKAAPKPIDPTGGKSGATGKPSAKPTKATETASKPASGAEQSKPSSHTVEKTPDKTRVTEPIKGVWEQNEHPRFHEPQFADLTIHETTYTENGVRVAATEILDSAGNQLGSMERAYDPATRTLELRSAFLDGLPNKIVPATGKAMTPKGTPTQTYLTLRQMKALGVEYGGLKKIKMSTIQNIQSVIELHVMKKTQSKMSLNEMIRRTHSVTYADTTLTQSGHRIVDVKYGGNKIVNHQTLDQLMQFYERGHTHHKPRDPAIVAKHDALIEKHGKYNDEQLVTRDTVVTYNYDIEITLAPVPPGGKP